MLSQELGKTSTDTADGCAGLEEDLGEFIISAEKSISKGLFSEAVIRGRLLSIGWWSLGSGMIASVWRSKEEITEREPQWRPWQIVQHVGSDSLERLRTWNKHCWGNDCKRRHTNPRPACCSESHHRNRATFLRAIHHSVLHPQTQQSSSYTLSHGSQVSE